jgi:hypothetical protein
MKKKIYLVCTIVTEKIKTKTEKKNREKPVRCRNRQRAQPTRVLKMWEKMI